LTRARIVMTDDEAPAARAEALRAIAFDRPIDEQKFRADLRAVRTRVEKERGKVPAGSRHLRFDPGGIMDVEFLVALGQLRHAGAPGVRTTITAEALSALVTVGWPVSLAEDYAVLRQAALRLRLLLDRPEDVISPRDLAVLARSLGTTPESLAAELDAAMSRIRHLFEQEF
jgi:glutamate-ammonia-ligase adenylyltransferase